MCIRDRPGVAIDNDGSGWVCHKCGSVAQQGLSDQSLVAQNADARSHAVEVTGLHRPCLQVLLLKACGGEITRSQTQLQLGG